MLFPETATNDESRLEEIFVEYLNSPEKRFKAIEYAWTKVNELYNFSLARTQIEKIYRSEN